MTRSALLVFYVQDEQSDETLPVATANTKHLYNQPLRCILHATDSFSSEDIVKPFDQHTWSQVQASVEVRRSTPNLSSSKYFFIIKDLPPFFLPQDGYHSKCYSNFTAVQRPQSIKHSVSERGDASSNPSSLRCVLHATDSCSSEDIIKPFDQHTWSQVQASVEVRRNTPNLSSSKYFFIIKDLPPSFLPQDGYHSKCYSKFTAVQRPQSIKHSVSERSDASNKPSSLRCILHATDSCSSEDIIKPFDQHTWSQVQASVEVRKNTPNLSSSKYFFIIKDLPSSFLPQDGYHSKCYSKFTAVQRPQSIKHIVSERGDASSNPSSLRCILHATDSCGSEDIIKPFDQHTWSRVQASVEVRRNTPNLRSSKYFFIIKDLPSSFLPQDGYHSKCYSNFTAVQRPQSIKRSVSESGDASNTPSSPPLLRTAVTSTGVFENACIFCNKIRKKRRGEDIRLGQCEYDSPECNVVEAANILKDSVMLAKVGSIGFKCKRVKYHHTCKTKYFNKARACKVQTGKDTNFKDSRDSVWNKICEFTEDTIITNNMPQYLVMLHHQYLQFCDEAATASVTFPYTTTRRFGDKLKDHFGKKITLAKSSRKQGLVVFSSTLSVQEALNMMDLSSNKSTIESAAKILRSSVLQFKATATKPPTPVTLDYIKEGEMEPPSILRTFFEILCSDTTRPGRPMADRTKRQIDSISSDVIYAVTNGEVKPAKHLCEASVHGSWIEKFNRATQGC